MERVPSQCICAVEIHGKDDKPESTRKFIFFVDKNYHIACYEGGGETTVYKQPATSGIITEGGQAIKTASRFIGATTYDNGKQIRIYYIKKEEKKADPKKADRFFLCETCCTIDPRTTILTWYPGALHVNDHRVPIDNHALLDATAHSGRPMVIFQESEDHVLYAAYMSLPVPPAKNEVWTSKKLTLIPDPNA